MDELQKLSLDELLKLFPSRQRRSLSRDLSDTKKKLLLEIQNAQSDPSKIIRTHSRDLIL